MRPVMILAALAALALASPSFAQKIDKNGRCHDASGKFAKADVCAGLPDATASAKGTASATGASAAATKTAGAAPAAGGAVKGAAAATDPKAPYKLDSKGKCHDNKGKMASQSKCA
jgi:hypothetical protein